MSSCVARRTTRCGESAAAAAARRAAGSTRTTVPTARAAIGLHDDLLARRAATLGWHDRREEGLRPSDRGQLHGDEPCRIGSAHGVTFYRRSGWRTRLRLAQV